MVAKKSARPKRPKRGSARRARGTKKVKVRTVVIKT